MVHYSVALGSCVFYQWAAQSNEVTWEIVNNELVTIRKEVITV
jgi:hypothetical protein